MRFGSTATGVVGVLCLSPVVHPELIPFLSCGTGPPPLLSAEMAPAERPEENGATQRGDYRP